MCSLMGRLPLRLISLTFQAELFPRTKFCRLFPVLIDNFNLLELISQTIEANEIIIAAVKLRSLVPLMKFSMSRISLNRVINVQGSLSLNLLYCTPAILTCASWIFSSLFFSLPEVHFVSSMHQIVGFDFNGNRSLDEFVAEKEAEITNEFVEVIPFIGQIKGSTSSQFINLLKTLLPKNFTTVYNLHCIKSRYGSFISL